MQEQDAPKHDLNGDHTPTNINGTDIHPKSPQSPPTPVSNVPVSDMKIDVFVDEQESDARNEPLPPRPDLHDASIVPQRGSPADPGPSSSSRLCSSSLIIAPDSIPIDPPTDDGTANHVNGLNGSHDQDTVMTDADEHTPAATPALSGSFTADSMGASTSHTTPNDADDDEDKPRPAKRPRVHSDADRASIPHVSSLFYCALFGVLIFAIKSPPPSTASADNTPVPPTAGPSSLPPGSPGTSLSVAQYRFCQSTVRSLKKLKDAQPFLKPVDPVALNIPHYPQIVKNPMDFSTIERKLTASNPVKPDPNPQNPRYCNADDFVADVRLIMSNCVTFNGPDHVITQMGRRVEEVFDKQIKNLPPAEVCCFHVYNRPAHV